MKADYSRLYVLLVSLIDHDDKNTLGRISAIEERFTENIGDTIQRVERITHPIIHVLIQQLWTMDGHLVTDLYEVTLADNISDIEAARAEVMKPIGILLAPEFGSFMNFYATAVYYGEAVSPSYYLSHDGIWAATEPLDHEDFDPVYTLIDIAKGADNSPMLTAKLLLSSREF